MFPRSALALVLLSLLAACGGAVGIDENGVDDAALATPSTLVTLTFDDNDADQQIARNMLNDAGIPATFYVITGQVGHYGLTLAQLKGLQAEGHDIGAHTVTHPHLTTLTPTEQKHEICDSRKTLIDWGFPAATIAWPYGEHNGSTDSIASSCGYAGARRTGGVRGETDCTNCAYAETRPPADKWAIREHTVHSTVTRGEMKEWVTEAEQHGGGWVVILNHHVCDGCSVNAISPADLQYLVNFIKSERTRGALTAHSMRYVMGNGSPLPK